MDGADGYAVRLAMARSPLRDALEKALTTEGCRVAYLESGLELVEVLSGTRACALVIIGEGVAHPSGMDAIYLAARARREGGAPRPRVVLVTEVRMDFELLEVWRSRGVDGFLYRDDALDKTLAELNAWLYEPSGLHLRYTLHIEAEVRRQRAPKPLTAAVIDLSAGGAQLVVPTEAAEPPLAIGERLELRLTSREPRAELGVEAEIRNVVAGNETLGRKLLVGVRFTAMSDGAWMQLGRLLHSDSST